MALRITVRRLDIAQSFQIWKTSLHCRELRPTVFARYQDATMKRLGASDWTYEAVLASAAKHGDLPAAALSHVPDEAWWKKLCAACGEKQTSVSGGHRLREKVVMSLSNRLAVEQAIRNRVDEFERTKLDQVWFVMGLPRNHGHYFTHLLYPSGHCMSPRFCDNILPACPSEPQRLAHAGRRIRNREWSHPMMNCVRTWDEETVDDDTTLHLLTPYSLAWGLLHGLPEYLYDCVAEDQSGVYATVHKVLRLYEMYRKDHNFKTGPSREVNMDGDTMNTIKYGTKDDILEWPWVVHSPFAVMNVPELHKAFPDMKLIWLHRAVDLSMASLASSLCMHNALYTGAATSDAVATQTGEIAASMFGSGSQHAIRYLHDFPFDRMVHASMRDVQRSGVRILEKTLASLGGIDLRFWRQRHAIDGHTEYYSQFRPQHVREINDFGLHTGALTRCFKQYYHQFDEYAWETKFGIEVQEYQPLAGSTHTTESGAEEPGELASAIGGQFQAAGDFLQQPAYLKRGSDDYLSSGRTKPAVQRMPLPDGDGPAGRLPTEPPREPAQKGELPR